MSTRRLLSLVLGAALFGTPALAADQPTNASADQEELVCKKVLETGSLVRKTKVCLTRAQWEKQARGHSQYGRDLQEALSTKPCGDPPC